MSVENVDVRYSGPLVGTGEATVTYAIRNTGNAILAAKQTVSIAGPFGVWRVSPAEVADAPPLLPGETWHASVPVHGVTPAVVLTGTVTVTPLLTDAAGSTTPLPTAETKTHAWAVPWALLVLVLVVLAAIVLVVRVRRRHPHEDTDTAPTDENDEPDTELAESQTT